jgi:hypothetical protein
MNGFYSEKAYIQRDMKLKVLSETLAVTRLESSNVIPAWAVKSTFFSLTKTADELSIVCDEKDVPATEKSERGWRCLKVLGPLDFSLTGILSSLAAPLAEARISIFAISTFETDYLLVKSKDLDHAVAVLTKAGFFLIPHFHSTKL